MLSKLKYSFFVILLISCSSVLGQHLIAYYPFDNSTADFSGFNNDGKFYGGVKTTADRFGNPCGALQFNGKDGYIQVPSSPSLKSPVKYLSVSVWFKLDSLASEKGNKWLTLICKGKDFEEQYYNPQYRVQVFQSKIQSTVSLNTDFTEYDTNFVKNSFPYGKWIFFVLVYDGKHVMSYIDGNKIWEFPYSKTFNLNNDPLDIGRDMPGHLEYFCGALDDLRIFNAPLSETEIAEIYHQENKSASVENADLICPANIIVNNDLGKCFAKVNYNKASLNYDCGSATIRQTGGLPSGSQFPIGTSALTFELKSKTGITKTCTTNIVVSDKEPPTFICPRDTVILNSDARAKSMRFSYKMPQATDNCTHAKVTLTEGLPSGSEFPEGRSTVKFVAEDENGNKAECSFSVFITHNTDANLISGTSCLPDIVQVNDAGKCGAIVTYTLPADNYRQVEGLASGKLFPVGTTLNKFQRSIGGKLKEECSFKVIVKDEEKPMLVCLTDTVLYCKGSEKVVNFIYPLPIATDNCSIEPAALMQGLSSGEAFSIGTTKVVYKVSDASGNLAECAFNVTVIGTNSVKRDAKEKTPTKSYLTDKVTYAADMKFKKCYLTLFLYDDGEEDNDTVSIFFNGEEIVKEEMIFQRDHHIIARTVALNPKERNDFIVKAWNVGNISPNTIKIEFYEGNYSETMIKLRKIKPKKVRVLHSKPGAATAISFQCIGQ